MELLDRDDYRYSFFDGMCANVYGTLTNGVFLTGFALFLGMNEFMIGLMAAIPYLVTLFQLPGSYYISKNGDCKSIAYRTAGASRLLWLPILTISLLHFHDTQARCLLVLLFYFIAQAFSTVSYVAWLSWTSDLVPDDIRGTFFGTRNMLCGAAGMAAVLIFGNLVDVLKAASGGASLAIAVPFLSAVLFGLFSLHYLGKVSPSLPQPRPDSGLFQELAKPFREGNFRRYLLFAFCWNFSVCLAGPFFSLYFLRDLSYSYGFVALLSTVSAVMDLIGMRFWGRVSDKIKNKAVIRLAGWGVVFLPAMWVVVRPQDVLIPVVLQIVSGGFWAGVNLCVHNLMLRISPQTGRVWFISAHSIVSGLGAAAAPILGGVLLSLADKGWPALGQTAGMPPIHLLFISSAVLRVLSLQIIRWVREPQENGLRQIFGVFWDPRRATTAATPFHPPGRLAALSGTARRAFPARRLLKRRAARNQI